MPPIREARNCIILLLSGLIGDNDSAVEAEVAEECKSCLVYIFGLYHVIEVMLHKVEHIECSALDLELIEAHRYILVPDIIGSDVCAQRFDIEKASVLAFALKNSLSFGVFCGKFI